MPTISQKGINMPASPIRKLTPFADQAKREGKKIYHLNIGQPDIETPEIMLNALKNIDFKVWAYTSSEGTLSYRTKLAEYYNKLNYNITPNDILVTNGGSEAITIAMQACLNPGEEVIIPEPFYANYNGFACSADIIVKPIMSVIDNGFALPSIADFEKVITEKTKAIAICNPNNPTGYLYSREELEALKELCLKHDLYLFSDEAYREFCYDGREFISPMQLEGLEENVVVFDTVSKRYSACGARIGCIITKNKELYLTALKFAQARLSPSLEGQIAGEAAVDTPDSYFEAVSKEYTARRDTLVNGLNKIEGVFCPNPGGAFYVIAKLPIDNADKFCQWMLEKFSYQNETVMMAPATGFYSTPGAGLNEVRLAYVLNQEDLKKALVCLEKGLQEYPGRTI
ncbi:MULTISPECIES: pyridoxal phosphate-dependent aminotransferase [Sphingobacterium]|uniref:Aspartate aminotransferase n=1 Tax=Sphingobacterium cellulitidis TaxID=1768011 RepID=A0A8H9KVU8_9SPHI|nr:MULTISPECIES: pyridoxal phosphate-dependent aminotransferase [Sphingobacterium]MBA8986552.1 aspartate aminotransferase [Sphingobacterium soli]OYD42570.1 aspartate aminotransferase [Sphingobacterium cellulitidis]OYD45181.1 aspartate aminotransferase [Sphingobacterium cellulitidis]WFB61888.1 pyridoxal phosphate-dependent aminotransferase [Sphingobacterium sp. WM]GGE21129.1 aspartate aminotransferase [Sphingobacterium soli]